MGGYLPLVHAALAAENLYQVSGDENYQTLNQTFERFVRAYLQMFLKGNHCVIGGDGVPYIWVYHTPGRDSENWKKPQHGFFRGHPIFGAEDNGHSGAKARNLPFVWEAGPCFGCSTALMAAYANAMADVLHNPNSRHTACGVPGLLARLALGHPEMERQKSELRLAQGEHVRGVPVSLSGAKKEGAVADSNHTGFAYAHRILC